MQYIGQKGCKLHQWDVAAFFCHILSAEDVKRTCEDDVFFSSGILLCYLIFYNFNQPQPNFWHALSW